MHASHEVCFAVWLAGVGPSLYSVLPFCYSVTPYSSTLSEYMCGCVQRWNLQHSAGICSTDMRETFGDSGYKVLVQGAECQLAFKGTDVGVTRTQQQQAPRSATLWCCQSLSPYNTSQLTADGSRWCIAIYPQIFYTTVPASASISCMQARGAQSSSAEGVASSANKPACHHLPALSHAQRGWDASSTWGACLHRCKFTQP